MANLKSQDVSGPMAMVAGFQYRMRMLVLQIGWRTVAGSLLIAVNLLGLLFVYLPQRAKLHRLEVDTQLMRKSIPQHKGTWIDHSPQAALNTFYDFLPPESAASKSVETVIKTAADHGIAMDKVEYQLSRNPSAAFSRYQVTLPVKADYVEVRRFVTEVLNALPNAALNDINFKRDEVNTGIVEARIRFDIYMRSETR